MSKVLEENRKWINDTWKKVDHKLSKVCIKSREKIPYTTINGVHDNKADSEADCWTNGFWGGMMWLMYIGTQNEEYKKTAIRSEELLDKALEDYKKLHHDVGFMWHLTSGANYRITGSKAAYNKNLFMASTLFSRFNIDGQYIRAWNKWTEKDENKTRTIIDSLMNIPLLYWASKEVEDERFTKVAMKHADMALRDHIRPDGSINHIVEHDENTGAFVRVVPGQGYSEDSCWSRGAAWAVYGSILSYIHTKEQRYLEAAKRTADYFIDKCQKDNYLTRVDFCAPEEPIYYDSTAGVCTACGLIELAKYVCEEDSERYLDAAISILKATDKEFCDYTDEQDALVLMGTERYPKSDWSMKSVHIPIIYGDFFFVEALLKLMGNEFLIW